MAFDQQATDEVGYDDLGVTGEERLGEGCEAATLLGGAMSYSRSVFRFIPSLQKTLLGLLPILASMTIVSSPSLASPYVYTTGGLLNADLKTCIADAKSSATQTGFTAEQEEVLDEDKKDGTFFASKPDAPISLAVRCFPTSGVYSLAVSGINNDRSFDEWKKFVNVFVSK